MVFDNLKMTFPDSDREFSGEVKQLQLTPKDQGGRVPVVRDFTKSIEGTMTGKINAKFLRRLMGIEHNNELKRDHRPMRRRYARRETIDGVKIRKVNINRLKSKLRRKRRKRRQNIIWRVYV